MRCTTPLRFLLVLALVSAFVLPRTVLAVTRDDLYRHRQAADAARRQAALEQQKANALVAETRKIEAQIESIATEVTALQGEIGTASERRTRLEQEMQLLRQSIDQKEQQITTVKAEYEAQTDALAARVDATYRAGDWAFVDWLLSAESIADLLERTDFVQQIMLRDEEIAVGLDQSRVSLEQTQQDLSRTLDEVTVKRSQIQAEEDKLRRLRSNRDRSLKAEESAKSQKQSLLAETKQNLARLKAIAAAEDAESARIASMLKSGGTSGSGRYAGSMTWPCPGHTRVSSNFGMRYHPILHYNRMHAGIDVSAPSGAQLVATGSGKIIVAGVRGGYGNCVMIDHGDGLVSVYAHMKSISVKVGQQVISGQTVGYVGSTGLSTGPHLHFEIRVNGNPVNPLSGYI